MKKQCLLPFQRPYRQRYFRGFTLIEVAIVLIIVGLILGGVLKGQALIDNARVQSLSNEVTGIRTAWFSFQDRYRSIPGDFNQSNIQIDSAAQPGNGNGRLDGSHERAAVWQQLALAGFINGQFDGASSQAGSANDMECAQTTCPQNPFNGFYKMSYGTQAADVDLPAHELITGNQIPVNILSQVDLRLDDGSPTSGRFRVHRDYAASCTSAGNWDIHSANSNCAAVFRD